MRWTWGHSYEKGEEDEEAAREERDETGKSMTEVAVVRGRVTCTFCFPLLGAVTRPCAVPTLKWNVYSTSIRVGREWLGCSFVRSSACFILSDFAYLNLGSKHG